jgi:release factor glutamine methyltransferase
MQEANYYLLNKIKTIYPEGEAYQITDWTMEHITGSQKAERMIYKNESITSDEEKRVKEYTERLMSHEPVQYVLGHAWFYGSKFMVDKNVLIPRPETEELVEWILRDTKKMTPPRDRNFKLLDVGTGSGCIAVSLKNKLPVEFEMWACDISDAALTVARKNADDNGALIDFVGLDFLDEAQRKQLPHFDIIVSNPPYVPMRDKDSMDKNVVDHEPHTALFVPDENALVFFDAIAAFGKEHLQKPGYIYCEIHENLGVATEELFKSQGYKTKLGIDMQGKNRMLLATIE